MHTNIRKYAVLAAFLAAVVVGVGSTFAGPEGWTFVSWGAETWTANGSCPTHYVGGFPTGCDGNCSWTKTANPNCNDGKSTCPASQSWGPYPGYCRGWANGSSPDNTGVGCHCSQT